ncbi:hypothetical protein BCEN4_850009 [Burkholderia cenocepacia]|nr:hypothetical protein BCEN4_850009 [Burkholderia cenocepacia]
MVSLAQEFLSDPKQCQLMFRCSCLRKSRLNDEHSERYGTRAADVSDQCQTIATAYFNTGWPFFVDAYRFSL